MSNSSENGPKRKTGVAYREHKYAVMKSRVKNMPSTVISSIFFLFFPCYLGIFSQWSCHDFRTFSITYQLLLLFWLLTLLNHTICCTKASCGAPGVWNARHVLGQPGPWAAHPWRAVLGGASSVSSPSSLPRWWGWLVAEMTSFQLPQWSFSRKSSCRITCRLSKT